jgi:HSP20 family protein
VRRQFATDDQEVEMAIQERRSTQSQQGRSAAPARRWEPAGDFEQITEQMRQLLDETFGGPLALVAELPWTPPVDVEEQDDAYVIEAEVPGVKREDVNIELVGKELTISGEIKERERAGILRRRTRRVGRFEYRVVLPSDVDGERVEAKLDDGVLSVRVPKAERAQRRKIEVKS